MSAGLERRYARLLGLYPAEYRRARGAELLETLLESAEDGRTRPAPREVRALVMGALRVHAGRHRRQGARHGWWTAFRAAALMLLVYGTASNGVRIAYDVTDGLPSMSSPPELMLSLLALAFGVGALAAALRGHYRSAVAATSATFLAALAATWPVSGPGYGEVWLFPLAVVLLLPLAVKRPLPPAGLLRYAPVVPLVIVATQQGLAQLFPDVAGILQQGLLFGLFLGGLLWLAVDERVAMALGLLLLSIPLIQVAFIAGEDDVNVALAAAGVAFTAFAPVTLLLASAAAARRRARF